MDELASAGIRILGTGSSPRAGGSGANAGGANAGGGLENGSALRRDRQDPLSLLADLEDGSGGEAGKVPFLMVGTKEDAGEGVRREGVTLATKIGMGHVAVVSFLAPDSEEGGSLRSCLSFVKSEP